MGEECDNPVCEGLRVQDKELVDRTITGDRHAFDCLVRRHRECAINLARGIVGDWDAAEDVAQQAFLEALQGLRKLQDASKFRPWLMTITRRCAWRHRNGAGFREVGFDEALMSTLRWSPPAVPDGIQERIRVSLDELSTRNRTVVVLHYLDGYSCVEIGAQLGLPTGTVKRILHESRNNLRAGMGLGTDISSTRGEPVPMASKLKDRKGPRNLRTWIDGNGGYGPLGRALVQSICLATNKVARGIQEISKEVDANPAYVREEVDGLVAEGLLEETSDGKYQAIFIALDAEDWAQLRTGLMDTALRFADGLQSNLGKLEDAWNSTALPGSGFSWEQGVWPTLAIFGCNIGLSRNSLPLPGPSSHASGAYWQAGYETTPGEAPPWVMGFNNTRGDEASLRHGFFWSYGLDREGFAFAGERTSVLTAVARGICDVDLIAGDACLDPEKVREVLAQIIESGVLRRESGALKLTIPVFRQGDSDLLTPAIDEVIGDLSRRILEPWLADLGARLDAMGYGRLSEEYTPIWRRWIGGNAAEEGVHELLRRGVLPDPGHPAPANFCMIGWFGNLPLMSW